MDQGPKPKESFITMRSPRRHEVGYRERERGRNRSRSREYDRERNIEYEHSRHKDREHSRHRHRDSERGRHRDSDYEHARYRSRDHHITRHDQKSSSSKYDLPTTESLHAKKLSALDHETFLQSRQKEREGRGAVGKGLLWPVTPPRAEFYFGNYNLDSDDEELVESVEPGEPELHGANDTITTTSTTAPEDETVVVRVKAPSALKPSINSFSSSSSKPVKYGGDMMPGEGTAMAGFVASGQRIPRRGEIGMDSDQISRFETAGYVMSGSRHHLMNAVRMRKENQVISAEEKRMISQMALEERVKREEEIVKTFKSMVEEKLKKKQNQQ